MKSKRKYKLIGKKGAELFQIQALRDIPEYNVKKGTLGGVVSGECNLSQTGECWIGRAGSVTGNAEVSGNAYVEGNVSGDARVFGEAYVSAGSVVRDHACVCGNSHIMDSTVKDSAYVFGEDVMIYDSCISEHACVTGRACLRAGTLMSGSAMVTDSANLNNARIGGSVRIAGVSCICEPVEITKPWHVFTCTGACRHPITVTRGGFISIGCQHGSLAWFKANKKELARGYFYTRVDVAAVEAVIKTALKSVNSRKH